MFVFDHLAIACERLDEGIAAVEASLGVPLAPGGKHPDFGTHNALLSLGGEEYLEVISIDPDAPPPERPRWFGLDEFSGRTRPVAWIARCPDLDLALDRVGSAAGRPLSLSRGAFRWRLTVPPDGHLPLGATHPALIEWQGPHPATRLPASGCRLSELILCHPEAERLRGRLGLDDPRIRFEPGAPGISVTIETPGGARRLK
jgi:hypothetical protein